VKLTAALFILVFVALSCLRTDDLVPIGFALLVAFVALGVVLSQLRAEHGEERRTESTWTRTGTTAPENDNGQAPGRRAS